MKKFVLKCMYSLFAREPSYIDEYINIINVDWISIMGIIFISVNSFFSFLVSSYPLNLNFKQRITKSFYFGILILSLNIICILILYIQM